MTVADHLDRICKLWDYGLEKAASSDAAAKSLGVQQAALHTALQQARQENVRAHVDLEKLYARLQELRDLPDENQRLQAAAAEATAQLQAEHKAHETARAEWRAQVAKLEASHTEALLALEVRCAHENERAVKALAQEMQEKSAIITELQQRLASIENAHHQHVMKLRLEFEQKLAAKTEQRAATTASDDRSSAQIHEIYRKKLMTAKAVSEKDATALRARIAELENKLLRDAGPTPVGRARAAAPYARKKQL